MTIGNTSSHVIMYCECVSADGFTLQRKAQGGAQSLAGATEGTELDHAQDRGHPIGGEGQVLGGHTVGHQGEDPQAKVCLFVLQAAQPCHTQGHEEEDTHAEHSGKAEEKGHSSVYDSLTHTHTHTHTHTLFSLNICTENDHLWVL